MKYAHDRWGATLFYIDSSVDTNGGTLPVSVFRDIAAALPDSLLIPEEATPTFFAYAAGFQSFLFHSDLGTPAAVRALYPGAFSVNMINDVDPGNRQQLSESVKHGDILMVHTDYWQQNNSGVMQIYADAPKLEKIVLSGRGRINVGKASGEPRVKEE